MSRAIHMCIVDDDDIYQYTITKTIQILGLPHKTSVFSDGEEALNFILANTENDSELPDIILLDINMPIMDGFQFMEEFEKIESKLNKEISIYMVSSSVDPVDIEKAKNIPAITDYIIKPLKPGDLKDIMQKIEN